MRQSHGLEKEEGSIFYMNSIQALNRYTKEDFEDFQELAKTNPAKLEDLEYLKKKNQELKEKDTFLVVSKEDIVIYNGDDGISSYTSRELEQLLPDTEGKHSGSEENGYYLDDHMQLIVKQINFRAVEMCIRDRYYVIRLDSEFDKKATEKKKEQLAKQQQSCLLYTSRCV